MRLLDDFFEWRRQRRLEAAEAAADAALEAQRKADNEVLEKVLARAEMNIFQYNTGVVRSTDDSFRVRVGGSWDSDWGDCVGLSISHEKTPGTWYPAHFSPARARVIAHHLLRVADHLEREEPSSREIDKPEAA